MFGYIRLSLEPSLNEAVTRIAEVAELYGEDTTGRVYVERGAAASVLWSLVLEAEPRAAARVDQLATRHGLDLAELVHSPPPSTALWRLLDALHRAKGGYVLIPSLEHLGGLGLPESSVTQLISSVYHTQVVWTGGKARSTHPPTPGVPSAVVSHVRVTPFGAATEIARIAVHRDLIHAGLNAMIEPVDALVSAVVQAAEKRWAADGVTLAEQLTVQISRPPSAPVLVIEFHQTHDAAVHAGATLETLCVRTHRYRAADGGMVTRYELALPESDTPLPAQPHAPCTGLSGAW
ncbi:hypothetical protein IU487_35095 [Nocardia puris]|uniref:hypothetical protein n=2 Tax=Nocardia TaxID=1817 RepID=UPI001895FC2B|nr:hypothetical protein [Nocardia puris]MBF6216224.1 hypothetical protein [Nocardia puris]